MTVEEELTGLCADAIGRVADLPTVDAVMEDSGRQRLAAYYLYTALLAGLIGPDDLTPERWPPELAEPLRQRGLARFTPRTGRALDAELTPAEQATRRSPGRQLEFAQILVDLIDGGSFGPLCLAADSVRLAPPGPGGGLGSDKGLELELIKGGQVVGTCPVSRPGRRASSPRPGSEHPARAGRRRARRPADWKEQRMTETLPAQGRRAAEREPADLRRVGINPDFWYPIAVSGSVRRGKTFAARFAGERIALYRSAGGVVYALEDRCAHRQVPLSMGVVEGEALRCCYHAWAYRGDGRISQIPYLPKGAARPPRGVRAYPVREAYGLVFVFPGDPAKADRMPLPELPEYDSDAHRTMTYSRTVDCHYSFMHENLLDMNHQFLHRGVVGRIHPELLDYETGLDWVQARYQFTHTAGKRSAGAALLTTPARSAPHVITIRTGYPYQTLSLSAGSGPPAFSLWAAYVPADAGQRTSHTFGLLMIAKPPVRGALNLAWPFIRRFTERVFAEDRMAVEAEQRAWDEQGRDCNREVFPLILDVRDVLRSNGVPIGAKPGCSGRC